MRVCNYGWTYEGGSSLPDLMHNTQSSISSGRDTRIREHSWKTSLILACCTIAISMGQTGESLRPV